MHTPLSSIPASRRPVGRVAVPLVLLAALVLGGCGDTSFVGRRFDNFTAYYNTFYNARLSFDKGVKALEKQDQPINRDLYLPLFTTPAQAAAGQDFENAIKKSADVLRGHPRSKWVDDALLLIGKSYFYQQNYVGAEQKFREVIDAGSPLQDEARFWLARSLIASGAYDQAAEHLSASLERDDLSSRWESMLRLALGELYVKRQAWEDAALELAAGIEDVRDGDLGARAQFLLGQVYEAMGRYEAAVEAYQQVQRFKPLYELSYAAQFNAIRTQGLHADADAALRALRRMERDDKNYGYRYELAYLRAQIYKRQHRADEALALYDEILYDADGNIANLRGRVHYALGELFRDEYRDYLYAAVYFDTARTTLRANTAGQGARGAAAGASREALFSPSAIVDAEEQATMFGTFARVYERVAEMDSLLYLGSLDETAFEARIMEIRQQRAREMAEQERLAQQQQALQRFQEGSSAASTGQGSRGEGGTAVAQSGGTAGFLFHRDMTLVAEGRRSFVDRWGERPLVPDWRRFEAIRNMEENGGEELVAQDGRFVRDGARTQDPSLPILDLSGIPRDSVRQAAMRAERAMARYELANVLFLSMSRPDTAAVWYRLVIDEDMDEAVAQRAYYALAEVHRALGDSAAAHRLYREVLQAYPDSDFAGRVREQLGLPAEQRVETDSLAVIEQAYDHAYARWRRGYYADALNKMVTLAARHPDSEVAPRALLAAGAIYVEWARRDSLDLFGPLPLQVPDSLLGQSRLFESVTETDSLGARGPAPAIQAADDAPGRRTAQRPRRPALSDGDTTLTSPPAAVLPEAAPAAVAEERRPAEPAASPDDAPADTSVTEPIAVSDSLLAAGDSLRAPSAGQLAAEDTSGTPPPEGQLASAEPDGLSLRSLYASITGHFPTTPYARRADALLEELESRRPVPENLPDSSAASPSDSLAADSLAADSLGGDSLAADSLGGDSHVVLPDSAAGVVRGRSERPDSTTAGAPPTAAAEEGDDQPRRLLPSEDVPMPDDDRPALRPEAGEVPEEVPEEAPAVGEDPAVYGPDDVAPERGGWTILVVETTDPIVMEQYASGMRSLGYRVGVLHDQLEAEERFRVVVGQFETEAAAREAIVRERATLPQTAEAVSLSAP